MPVRAEPERAIALGAFRESHGEDREGGRRDERRPEALQGPGADQELGGSRHAREQ
jgi:hypothetical protein